MTNTALQMRRWVGKVVLFLALCWLVVVIAMLAGAAQGASVDLLNVMAAILPGCAFLPAAYFAVRLHQTADREQVNRIWPKTLVYGVAGVVLLFGAAYGLYQAGPTEHASIAPGNPA